MDNTKKMAYILAKNREDCVTELSFGNLQFYNVMYVMLWAAWSFVFVFVFFPDCNSCTILPNFSRFDKVISLSENFLTSFVPRDIRDKTRSFSIIRDITLLMMENRFTIEKLTEKLLPLLTTLKLIIVVVYTEKREWASLLCQENFPFIQC